MPKMVNSGVCISNFKIKSFKEEPLIVRIYSKNNKCMSTLSIDKGFVHVASKVYPGDECTLSENKPFSVRMNVMGMEKQKHIAIMRVMHEQSPICSVMIDSAAVHRIESIPGFSVTGLDNVAEHLLKKNSLIPRTTLIGSFDLNLASLPNMDFVSLCNTIFEHNTPPSASEMMRDCTPKCMLPHSMKTTFHYNNKLVSLINTAYTDYDLPHSRGLLLNACLAFNSSYKNSPTDYRAIVVDTLETVPLTACLSPSDRIRTRLSVKTSNGVQKIPVYEADDDTLQLLVGTWGVSESAVKRPVLYLFSVQNVPILFGAPLERTLEEARSIMSHSRGNSWQKPLSTATNVVDLLHIMNFGKEVWRRDSVCQKQHPGAWQKFATRWKDYASAMFPASAHIFHEAAYGATCSSIPALICLLEHHTDALA
jgi:hypothetical protein